MKKPSSKTATTVNKDAPLSCALYFVCKGALICTRQSPQQFFMNFFKSTRHSSTQPEGDDSQDGSVASSFVSQDLCQTPAEQEVQLDDEMYFKLLQALVEAGHVKHQAYEESSECSTVEQDSMKAKQRVETSGIKRVQRMKVRKVLWESITRLMMEVENLETEQHKTLEQLKSALGLKAQLEMQIVFYISYIKHLEGTLSSAHEGMEYINSERDTMRQERDATIKVAEKLRREMDLRNHAQILPNFLEFPFSELLIATQNFEASQKIGEGGYGIVYKGFLRHTAVAVKVLRSQNSQGESEFLREVEILSKVRHPHLVTLIGACPEKRVLVLEYLPNGSLEDHLALVNNASPLSWQARVRIASEICSALIFLHASKPQRVVHGDLKPSNILLDANLTSKLSDFGISCLLIETGTTLTLSCQTGPAGTLVYMDPELLRNGRPTIQSDVYSFGVILLRMLTGKPPIGIFEEVGKALSEGMLQSMLDPTAGDWPFVQAQQLAELALRCCELSRDRRPDLEREVWKVIAPMTRPLSQSAGRFL